MSNDQPVDYTQFAKNPEPEEVVGDRLVSSEGAPTCDHGVPLDETCDQCLLELSPSEDAPQEQSPEDTDPEEKPAEKVAEAMEHAQHAEHENKKADEKKFDVPEYMRANIDDVLKLNIRDEASKDSKIVGTVTNKERLRVIDNTDPDYVFVEVVGANGDELIGYVKRTFVVNG